MTGVGGGNIRNHVQFNLYTNKRVGDGLGGGGAEFDGISDTSVPEGSVFLFFFPFSLEPVKGVGRCGLFPLKALTLVLMAFQPQDCRCRKVIVECSWVSLLSYTHTSLPFSHPRGVSLCFALSLSHSLCVPSLLFHSPLLSSSHSWSVSATENYCAHTDGVIAGGMKRSPVA